MSLNKPDEIHADSSKNHKGAVADTKTGSDAVETLSSSESTTLAREIQCSISAEPTTSKIGQTVSSNQPTTSTNAQPPTTNTEPTTSSDVQSLTPNPLSLRNMLYLTYNEPSTSTNIQPLRSSTSNINLNLQHQPPTSTDTEFPVYNLPGASMNDQSQISSEATTPTSASRRSSTSQLASPGELENCIDDLPDEILDYIFSFLNFVERLRLESVCKRWYLIGRCPTKLKMNIEYLQSRKLNDTYVCSLLSRCGTELKELSLGPNPELTCHSLGRIGELCPNLSNLELNLVDVRQIECLKLIATGCPNLKVIKIEIHRDYSTEISDESNDNQNSHDEVHTNNDENDDSIDNIRTDAQSISGSIIPLLEGSINTEGMSTDGDEDGDHANGASVDPESIEDNPQENYYQICNDSYNEGLFGIALHCQALEYIHITSLWSLAIDWLELLNPNLLTLSLENCGFTSEGMECLMTRCNSLQAFALDGCRQISQPILFQFLRHYQRTLTLLRISYGFDWFLDWRSVFRDLVNLRVLDLYCCDLVDDALMEVIGMHCLKIRFLDIGGTDVTDPGLIALRGLPKLKELRLTYQSNGITGYGLEALVAHGILRKITISSYGSVKEVCLNLASMYTNVHFILVDP